MIKLVGHRGLPEHFPENTLIGMQAAMNAGADGIECDIQFSADEVPYLLHDESFSRVSDRDLTIAALNAEDVNSISVHEPTRFAEKFNPCLLTPLVDLVSLMEQSPKTILFAEIKKEIFNTIPRPRVVEILNKILAPIYKQLVVISFDQDVLCEVKKVMPVKIGWVLTSYDHASAEYAAVLKPEFIVCNYTKLASKLLWPGGWHWFVYDVTDKEIALTLYQQGITWMESWDVAALKSDLYGE